MKPKRPVGPVLDPLGKPTALPGRVVETNSGCYNCLHFEYGEIAFRERLSRLLERDTIVFKAQAMERGKGELAATQEARSRVGRTRSEFSRMRGHIGFCRLASNTESMARVGHPGDFTSNRHVCIGGWTGVTGASLAREPGESLSPMIEEVYDRRGEVAPIVSRSAADDAQPEPAEAPSDDPGPEAA